MRAQLCNLSTSRSEEGVGLVWVEMVRYLVQEGGAEKHSSPDMWGVRLCPRNISAAPCRKSLVTGEVLGVYGAHGSPGYDATPPPSPWML